MEEELQSGQGGVERKMSLTQLVQIKYILAGILALAVFGRAEDWEMNCITVAVTFSFIYSAETCCAWIPGSVSRLASIHRRRKASAAEGERRMRQFMSDLEEAERQVRSE